MSKVPNPVRGYVTCPVCSSGSTVHIVGEGKLITHGEPPKNTRNAGLKYYRCPECGNSPMSKSVHSYIEQHSSDVPIEVETVSKPLPVQSDKTSDETDVTESSALLTESNEPPQPLIESEPNALPEQGSESAKPENNDLVTAKPKSMVFKVGVSIAALALVLVVMNLVQKRSSVEQGGEDE
ncbi:hypothetical protein [Vibrio methylphosphonaticus]|uniref:hypothetical protein n=1 Tax=Vibrio methylphosphonaticus TaxID=2946866 RepID=UPI00202A9519|nr:hypothetical protein [Vibrio methylphosphonaticus]MCL9777062.1 hypothetical protein [Vibrio methylphosphonaticus]